MFPRLTIDEPIEKVVDDWDFFDEKILPQFATFNDVGDNVFGIRARDISQAEINDPNKGNIGLAYEIGPEGLMSFMHRAQEIHVVLSGTPHHVPHNFGYWHVNDMDELYLAVPTPPGAEHGFYAICMGNPGSSEKDAFAWYCEECLNLLHMTEYDTGAQGAVKVFWDIEWAAVTDFNSDPKNRVCDQCGHVNPAGYSWNPGKDTPEMKEARMQW